MEIKTMELRKEIVYCIYEVDDDIPAEELAKLKKFLANKKDSDETVKSEILSILSQYAKCQGTNESGYITYDLEDAEDITDL